MTFSDPDIFNESAGYFQSEAHCRLIANGVCNHLEKTRGVALVTGGPATLQALLRNLNTLVDATHIRCRPEITAAAIVEAYVDSLGLRAAADGNTGKWPRLGPSGALSGRTRLLALKKAELLSAEALGGLFSVQSIADPDRPPILLMAAEEIIERLANISGDLLGSTIFAHFPGERLAEVEVGPFIVFQQSDGETAAGKVFRSEIVELIAAFADGDPAIVNSLAVGILEAARDTAHPHDKAREANTNFACDEAASSAVLAQEGVDEAAENLAAPADPAQFEELSGSAGAPVLDTVVAIAVDHDDGGEPNIATEVRDSMPIVAEAAKNLQAIPAPHAAGPHNTSPASDGESRSEIAISAEVLEAPTAGLLDRPKENRAELYSGAISSARQRPRARSVLRWLAAGTAFALVSAGAVLYRLGPPPVGPGSGEDRIAQPTEVLPTAVAQPLDQPGKPLPPAIADATTVVNPLPASHESAPLVPSSGNTMAQPTSVQDASQHMPEPAKGAAAAPPVAAATKPSAPAAPSLAAIPTEHLVATIDPAPAMRAADAPQPMAKAEPSGATANGTSTGEAGPLVRRGDQLMSIGDIASARSFFELAAAKDEGAVATRIAKTYDPLFLEQSGVHGTLGNATKALAWYRKGITAGDLEAVIRFQLLRDKYPE